MVEGGEGESMAVIGIDCDTLSKGTRFGDERYLRTLLGGLASIDSKDEYVLYTNKGGAREARTYAGRFKDRCRVRTVRPSPLPLRVPFSLPFMAGRDGCDLLHTQYFTPPVCPCPVVLTVHDVSFMRHPEFFDRLEARLFPGLIGFSARKAGLIVTDSAFSGTEIRALLRVPGDRIRVIPLAVDPCFEPLDRQRALDRVRGKYGMPFGRFLLSVGEIQPRKNVDRLLHAFARLRVETGTDCGLVLVGNRKYADFDPVRLIEAHGLSGTAVHTGFVPQEDLVDFYCAADLFVFPSLYEGFGLPPLEAMACGTPVAASDKGALPEVLGDAAAYFDPLDTDAITASIRRLLESEERRAALRRAGPARAALFPPGLAAQRTRSLYDEIREGRLPGA